MDGIVSFDIGDTFAMTSYADDLKLFSHTGPALTALFEATSYYLAAFGMVTAVEKSHVL